MERHGCADEWHIAPLADPAALLQALKAQAEAVDSAHAEGVSLLRQLRRKAKAEEKEGAAAAARLARVPCFPALAYAASSCCDNTNAVNANT